MPPRISPLTDACHHVGLKTDKTWKLEVKYINAVKGKIMAYGISMDGWMDGYKGWDNKLQNTCLKVIPYLIPLSIR